MSVLEALEKKYLQRIEYLPGFMGFIDNLPNSTFDLEEAMCLVGREFVDLDNEFYLPNPPKKVRSVIVGLVNVNKQVEIITRFGDRVNQLTKSEFCGTYYLVPKGN